MALVIAFEGLPGGGKTTIIKMLIKELSSRGLKAEKIDIEAVGHAPIRKVAETFPFGHVSRTLLLWVLRLQQYDAIEEKKNDLDVIFADRFWGSAIAYDVYGNKIPPEVLEWVSREMKHRPDVTFLFEAPIGVVRKRKETKTTRNPKFAKRVEQGYHELAEKFSWHRIDATKSIEEVKDDCLAVIDWLLKQKRRSLA